MGKRTDNAANRGVQALRLQGTFCRSGQSCQPRPLFFVWGFGALRIEGRLLRRPLGNVVNPGKLE
jgi:hypothetical protein